MISDDEDDLALELELAQSARRQSSSIPAVHHQQSAGGHQHPDKSASLVRSYGRKLDAQVGARLHSAARSRLCTSQGS